MQVAIDSSVLVGLINPADLWRERAMSLHSALLTAGYRPLYFDCVAVEAVSAAVRRLHEKGNQAGVKALLARLNSRVSVQDITWVLPDVPRLYAGVLDLIRTSAGSLNFHDALIALACRERGIPAIASFDADFDQIPWLRRLSLPEDITP
ncbi:MAG TPA: PIN domain-containing protein [Anaerolineae bacterium]|nr:PIN domain-containing protein [Anaerolineae bacterium]